MATVAEDVELDDATRERFLKGLDDIGITLANEADITAFETARPAYKLSITNA